MAPSAPAPGPPTQTSSPQPSRPHPVGAPAGVRVVDDPAADVAQVSPRRHRALAFAAFAVPVVVAAAIGARTGPTTGATGRWYRGLRKPPFQPPPQVFGPVWTVLYATIAISGFRVWDAPDHPMRRPALALWATQLAANAAWTPTFFGARRPRAALGVLGVQLASAAAYAGVAGPVDGTASALMAPYLAWSGFAGALNEEIVRRNPGV